MALEMMRPLSLAHIQCFGYGSIARGDVSWDSDIDVFMPNPPAPAIIEAVLSRTGKHFVRREIVQATPNYVAKGHLYIDDLRTYSFPLVGLRSIEKEFYSFAGNIHFSQLLKGVRVPGVDKRLMLIEPVDNGHIESPVRGRAGIVAKILNVDINIVNQRVRILERRSKVGRTGVYLKYALSPDESFGEVLNALARSRPALRRRIRKK
jgi:predicted nucleotidyltransferase